MNDVDLAGHAHGRAERARATDGHLGAAYVLAHLLFEAVAGEERHQMVLDPQGFEAPEEVREASLGP